ncbi:hypothetical protein D9613_008954 [Agrocybe pediades]|uniref:C2H2-type domain-containing protein n=1 Tax=Agrocybe pediades TaxID=84607 RepID=A0A8H4QT44_9AGAR|nr:hypothetical protein D9613_008954 [Agrocybe pediades]
MHPLKEFNYVYDFDMLNEETGELEKCGRKFKTQNQIGHHKPTHNPDRPAARKVRRTRRTVVRRQQRVQVTPDESFNDYIPYAPRRLSEHSDLTAMSISNGLATPPLTYSYGTPTYVTHASAAHLTPDA